MAEAICYLCMGSGGEHSLECAATPDGAVPLGCGNAWRQGVYAAAKVMKGKRCDSCKYWADGTSACTAISIDAPKRLGGALLLITTADFGCVRWKGKA